jgi:hypothetical protein
MKADSAFGFMNQSVASSDFSAVYSYQALNYKPKSAQDGGPKMMLRNRSPPFKRFSKPPVGLCRWTSELTAGRSACKGVFRSGGWGHRRKWAHRWWAWTGRKTWRHLTLVPSGRSEFARDRRWYIECKTSSLKVVVKWARQSSYEGKCVLGQGLQQRSLLSKRWMSMYEVNNRLGTVSNYLVSWIVLFYIILSQIVLF